MGQVEKSENFVALTANEVVIETRRRRIRVSIDGEVTIMQSPLHYSVLVGGLLVAVPRPDSDDKD